MQDIMELNVTETSVRENTTRIEAQDFEYELIPGAKETFYISLGMQWLNALLIISLNIAVIVTITRYKKKSRLYFLLMNMAIADLTTGVIDAMVNALERTLGIEYLNYVWFGGDVLCKLQRTLSSTSLCASNFILAVASLDRALVIAKPMLNFKRGYTLQKILILVCWLLSATISSPLLTIYSKVDLHPSFIEGSSNISLCNDILTIDGWKILFILMLTFYFILPLLVIIASYTILISAVYKRARTPPNGFIFAWTPFFVVLYMNIFHSFNNPVIMAFVTTYYWNCSINPIIFFVFHKRRPQRRPASLYSSDTPLSKLYSGRVVMEHV